MKRAAGLIAAALVAGCVVFEVFKEPSPTTYTAGSRELKIGEAVSTVPAAAVTLDFFREANAQPFIGRVFVEADRAASAPRVVVLSHDLWTRHFGAQPDVIGRAIDIDGRPAIVVGVAPRGFSVPNGAQLWTVRR